MEIVEYDPKYKQDFIDFNTAWIVDNFGALEAEDRETFAQIEASLENGGMIYFAVEHGTALATCMVRPLEEANTWEICKLASNKSQAHKGCGSAVFQACIQWAAGHGAKRLFILSNRKLKAALHIYEKFGFRELRLKDYAYERGNIAFERFL